MRCPIPNRAAAVNAPPPSRSSAGGTGGGPLPTVALVIGVIVAGLGIGALVSAFQNRGTLPRTRRDLGAAW